MFDDDDFKISMDDIMDMVSVYFGEKVEKIDKTKAKEILSQETKEFFENDLGLMSAEEEKKKEEAILDEYEKAKLELEKETPSAAAIADSQKHEAELKEKIKKELLEEAARKKEAVLKKIETVKQESKVFQDSLSAKTIIQTSEPAQTGTMTTHAEKVTLMQMFDNSQKLLFNLIIKIIRKAPVETMFLKTMEKAMAKHRDVLRKADHNHLGQVRTDGSLEMGRVAANVNALYQSEAVRNEMFYEAIRDIFEERLIAIELASSIETKDDLMSNLLNQIEQVFIKKSLPARLIAIFMEKIVPNTTMKPGE